MSSVVLACAWPIHSETVVTSYPARTSGARGPALSHSQLAPLGLREPRHSLATTLVRVSAAGGTAPGGQPNRIGRRRCRRRVRTAFGAAVALTASRACSSVRPARSPGFHRVVGPRWDRSLRISDPRCPLLTSRRPMIPGVSHRMRRTRAPQDQTGLRSRGPPDALLSCGGGTRTHNLSINSRALCH
jgi:hypothetical protein